MESRIETQLREVEAQIYGELEKDIADKRQQEENAIATANISVKQLVEVRKSFNLILQNITNLQ